MSARPAKILAERISHLGALSQFATELKEPVDSVLNVFSVKGPLHIIMQKLLCESYVDLVKWPVNVILLSKFSTYLRSADTAITLFLPRTVLSHTLEVSTAQ